MGTGTPASRLQPLGRRISERRAAAGLTQQQLSARIAMSRAALSHLEAGITVASERSVCLLAGVFGLEPHELVAGHRLPARQGRAAATVRGPPHPGRPRPRAARQRPRVVRPPRGPIPHDQGHQRLARAAGRPHRPHRRSRRSRAVARRANDVAATPSSMTVRQRGVTLRGGRAWPARGSRWRRQPVSWRRPGGDRPGGSSASSSPRLGLGPRRTAALSWR